MSDMFTSGQMATGAVKRDIEKRKPKPKAKKKSRPKKRK